MLELDDSMLSMTLLDIMLLIFLLLETKCNTSELNDSMLGMLLLDI